jgi:hypothetical protein
VEYVSAKVCLREILVGRKALVRRIQEDMYRVPDTARATPNLCYIAYECLARHKQNVFGRASRSFERLYRGLRGRYGVYRANHVISWQRPVESFRTCMGIFGHLSAPSLRLGYSQFRAHVSRTRPAFVAIVSQLLKLNRQL